MSIINLLTSIITGKISVAFLKSLIPLFSNQAQKLVIKILPEACKIVFELASTQGLTDKQKQKAAFERLTDFVKKEGIEAGNSLLNLIIELAVAQLKK